MANVLLVDDDPRVRRFATAALREAGHLVTALADAETALARVLEVRPDVFLLDINLPGMHGIELAQRLRKFRGMAKIPVVILSVRTHPSDKVVAFASGAIRYLEKPFKKAELLDAVGTALDWAAARS
jgi:DNA-binding response OmpR family regulator